MHRFRLAGALLLTVGLLVGATAQPSPISVTVNVSLDNQPADALVVALQNDGVVDWSYTDVHTPGTAHLSLAPGDYRLRVEHGVGFTSTPETLDLTVEDSSVEVPVSLERTLDPNERGYYGVDLHTHTAASAPAMERDFGIANHGVTPVDQVVGVQLAAGLDAVFISDHNSVGGHEAFVETADARGVPYVLSEEITTLRWGHFNVYSLDPGEPVEFQFGKTPSAYFAEAREAGASIVQVNHPLYSNGGYWYTRSKSGYDSTFDAAEAFNGSFDEADAEAIRQLYRFWNEGQRYVATASSDDHDWNDDHQGVGSRYGTPRTYVNVDGEPTADAMLASLRDGHAFLTHGPMLYLSTANGAVPGDTIQASGPVTLQARTASVRSLDGLRAEWVFNGDRLDRVDLQGQAQTITLEHHPSGVGWYLVRLVDPSGRVRAMTNPIWIDPGS